MAEDAQASACLASDAAEIRPETCALVALIRETLARRDHAGPGGGPEALLFRGHWRHTFPTLVIQDPVLEPVDKLVWMVIWQAARDASQRAVFPGYGEIARQANVSSTSTVARALAILRATRWLSLCVRLRAADGRYAGNVYALHDEPLPVADAAYLDPGYRGFLENATNHVHARVRCVARAMLAALPAASEASQEAHAPAPQPERRGGSARPAGRRYFSFSAAALGCFAGSARPRDQSLTPADQQTRDRISKTVTRRTRKSKPVARSSSSNLYINTTTTTASGKSTTDRQRGEPASEAISLDGLVLPVRLQASQRELAARYLAMIAIEYRQPVLDELAGRFQAEQRGAKPVYDELRYLHHLCVLVTRGRFVPNLGLKVAAEREKRRREVERLRADAETRERERQARAAQPPNENPLAEIRKLLGMPRSHRPRSR